MSAWTRHAPSAPLRRDTLKTISNSNDTSQFRGLTPTHEQTMAIWTVRPGLVPYEDARALQKEIEGARQVDAIPDVLLLLEHPPVYTKGRRTTADELPMGEDWYRRQGIEVIDTDRGGRVTYHGPGQLVGYPILSLKPYRDDVHEYIRRM